MNANLKAIGANLVNLLSNLFVINKPIKQQNKSLVIIRLDAIGDYFLFRKSIEYIFNSDKYKDYELTLIGNSAWKELAEYFDSNYIKNFIWVNTKIFNKNLVYRISKLKEIRNKHYDIAISPVYSRYIWRDDAVIKSISADEKIGFSGEPENCSNSRILLANKYYTKIIQSEPEVVFESKRNNEFIKKLINEPLKETSKFINIDIKNNFSLPPKYVVIFIGSSAIFRKWDINKYVKISKWLINKGLNIVLCGGKSEIKEAELFEKIFKDNFINLVNKTSIIQLLYVLNNAEILISNETSAPHFAMALNTKQVIVISNGNHFKRFNPYPSPKYHIIYPPYIEKTLLKNNGYCEIINQFSKGSDLNINEITEKRVINELENILRIIS